MLTLIGFATTLAATLAGYFQSRRFVQRRLRFVEAIHKPGVPVLVGVAAGAAVLPVVWVLPLVGGGTAALFGLGVGAGVAAGRREIRWKGLLNG